MSRSKPMVADDVLDEFLADLAASPARMRKIRTEGRRIVPAWAKAAERYQDETDQLARFLQVQAAREEIAA